jgi:hypothetical protein
MSVTWALDDSYILVTLLSKNVYMLDASTGQLLGILSKHTEQVLATAVLASNEICSGGADG